MKTIRLNIVCSSDFGRYAILFLDFFDHGWSMLVVNIGIHSIKPHGTKQLFVIQTSVWFSKLNVSFGRNLTQFMIKWHGCKFKN